MHQRGPYPQLELEHMALLAVRRALGKAGRRPAEIGAVVFCSCTSNRLIPSTATSLCGELGMQQTYAAFDLVAAMVTKLAQAADIRTLSCYQALSRIRNVCVPGG